MRIEYMDLKEFVEDGYLQEANRRFFHPLGLALSVQQDEETGEYTKLDGLWDYRDDAEGMVFGEGYGDDPDKAHRVQEVWDSHAAYRQEHFGWVIQPVRDGQEG